jgi:hypothetical protein
MAKARGKQTEGGSPASGGTSPDIPQAGKVEAPVGKSKAALATKLGIEKEKLATLPFKGTLAYATSKITGGKHTFIEFARHSKNEKIMSAVHKWDSLSKVEKGRTSLDMLCTSVDIPPADLLKEVTGIAYELNTDISNFIAAAYQPQVVTAGVKRAMQRDGVDDRRMLYQHSNFIPTNKGTNIAIGVNASAQAAAAAKNTVQGDESGLPDFETDTIRTIASVRGDDSIEVERDAE